MVDGDLSCLVSNGFSHALCVIDILTKNDGFCKWVIGGVEELDDFFCDETGALVKHEDFIHVCLVVGAAFDFVAKVIGHAFWWSPAF